MTTVTLQDGQVVLRDGKVGTEASCCCEACDVCFVAVGGTYNFTFDGNCNGNAVNYSGQLVNGSYFSGGVSVTLACTSFEPCGAGGTIDGLLMIVDDGTCSWEYVLPCDPFSACPSNQITPVGTYTLDNCGDATAGTLVIS